MSDSAPPPPPSDHPYGPPAGGYGGASGAPATLLPRFAARLLDLIIVVVAAGIVGLIVRVIFGRGYLGDALAAVVSAAIYLGYFVYLEASRGQTVGKMALSLCVVGPDGSSRPTLEESVKRNMWTVLGVLGVLGALGTYLGGLLQLVAVIVIAVTISSDTVRRQSWFDKFAGGTQVLTNS